MSEKQKAEAVEKSQSNDAYEFNHQEISDLASVCCTGKGYLGGPTRKVAYQAFYAGMLHAERVRLDIKRKAGSQS